MKNNKKEYYFIDSNQIVKIDDIIVINNIRIPLTNEIINNNPHKFYPINNSIHNNNINNDIQYIYEYFKYWENAIISNPNNHEF